MRKAQTGQKDHIVLVTAPQPHAPDRGERGARRRTPCISRTYPAKPRKNRSALAVSPAKSSPQPHSTEALPW